MPEPVDHRRFIELLTERFPEIAAGIDECARGLLHPEMGTLARATQAAMDHLDKTAVVQHFQFIDEVYYNAAPDVKNAVYVSYLENLRFDTGSAEVTKARELLTPRLRDALAELEMHLSRIHG